MIDKIEVLTEEQEIALEKCRDHWFRVGSCTDPADRSVAEAVIKKMYKIIGEKEPRIIWFDSPVTAILGKLLIEKAVGSSLEGNLKNSLEDSFKNSFRDGLGNNSLRDTIGDTLKNSLWSGLWDSLGNSLWDSLGNSFGNNLWSSPRNDFEDSLWDSLWDSLKSSLEGNLKNSLEDSLKNSFRDNLKNSLWGGLWSGLAGSSLGNNSNFWHWGQMDAFWVAFYSFCQDIGVKYEEQSAELLEWNKQIVKSSGWLASYRGLTLACERPVEIHWTFGNHPVPHKDGGPALLMRDGWAVWHLNGVRVSQRIAETPAEELSAKLVLEEDNVEIRREIVRKIGIERVCEQLNAKCIDREDDYELLMLSLGDGRRRPYLKMLNPSIGVYHIEGVLPSCTTVMQALEFRNGTNECPTIIT